VGWAEFRYMRVSVGCMYFNLTFCSCHVFYNHTVRSVIRRNTSHGLRCHVFYNHTVRSVIRRSTSHGLRCHVFYNHTVRSVIRRNTSHGLRRSNSVFKGLSVMGWYPMNINFLSSQFEVCCVYQTYTVRLAVATTK
jgi:hypothetical protein